MVLIVNFFPLQVGLIVSFIAFFEFDFSFEGGITYLNLNSVKREMFLNTSCRAKEKNRLFFQKKNLTNLSHRGKKLFRQDS
jgi:hypothetical protein